MNADQVLPHVVVGPYPQSTEDIDRLAEDFGITAVLSVQTDEDLDDLNVHWTVLQDHYRDSAIELRQVPVRDFDPEDLRRNLPDCVLALRQLVRDGHVVYVHCTAGMGRSPSVVVAYLHWVERWDLDDAAKHVVRCRPSSPDLEAIRLADVGPFRSGPSHDQQ